ncbi:hypothetical protein AMTR_s00027p00242530 [Amborella trichopoda]|uniref:Uncharacterized protein n=1 Tax=Amborella trichopoda TaxID=13333 RepID=W1PS25_AMBTC|nr:hypothetical protein AMTR_s00027p00242530 [Amborella trichopoda]
MGEVDLHFKHQQWRKLWKWLQTTLWGCHSLSTTKPNSIEDLFRTDSYHGLGVISVVDDKRSSDCKVIPFAMKKKLLDVPPFDVGFVAIFLMTLTPSLQIWKSLHRIRAKEEALGIFGEVLCSSSYLV